MMQKTINDPDTGKITLKKSTRSRRISLKVTSDGSIVVTMPFYVPYSAGLKFCLSKKEWILKVRKRLEGKIGSGEILSPEQVEEMRRQAKETLPARLSELAARHSFKFSSVRIKHNSSNWGSCSQKGNINLNLNLVRVPEDLQDYVMLHELCHLVHPNHGTEFHALLESLCPEHRQKEKRLRQYRLL